MADTSETTVAVTFTFSTTASQAQIDEAVMEASEMFAGSVASDDLDVSLTLTCGGAVVERP